MKNYPKYHEVEAYQKFANEIDKYFEYRSVSVEDQEFVKAALTRLLKRLSTYE